MNYGSIRYIIGWILRIEGILMALPILTAIVYQEQVGWAFVATAGLCLILGTLIGVQKTKKTNFYAKEGYISVALGWIVLSIMGCLPFVISGEIPSFIDAWFEMVSGFTTTGASILNNVEGLSKCMLIWRSFSHWVGGMGVLVFIMAVLPLAGGEHNLQLMKAESPGPSVSKLVPKLRETAIMLYKIYLGMTVGMIVLYLIGGLPLFDSCCMAFGTAGTGGFGILNDSMGSYSTFVQAITTVGMMLFGVNFSFYFLILYRKAKEAFHMEEVRWYFIIYFGCVILITLNLGTEMGSILERFHHAAFQAASIMTTTGYSTVDFNLWLPFAKGILLLLMFVGACAGSTGGGMKVSRIMILFKSIIKEIKILAHPKSTVKITMNGHPVEHETVRAVNVYTASFFAIFVVSLLIISLDNFDFATNFTAVTTTLNNMGPGLSKIGPTMNFSEFSNLSKVTFSIIMLIGRLEIFPMLVLLAPTTWKK